jgi:hypothetical protein
MTNQHIHHNELLQLNDTLHSEYRFNEQEIMNTASGFCRSHTLPCQTDRNT